MNGGRKVRIFRKYSENMNTRLTLPEADRQMVYKLYDLTDEGIEVVEDFDKK